MLLNIGHVGAMAEAGFYRPPHKGGCVAVFYGGVTAATMKVSNMAAQWKKQKHEVKGESMGWAVRPAKPRPTMGNNPTLKKSR
jgi:hypothetical protein